MAQSKLHSLLEAVVNTLVGLVIAMLHFMIIGLHRQGDGE